MSYDSIDRRPVGSADKPLTDDGSGQPENDKIAADIRKRTSFVGPQEVAEMAAAERIEADQDRALKRLNTPYIDMVATIRHEAEYAQEVVERVRDQLHAGKTYQSAAALRGEMQSAWDVLSTAIVAIGAIKKAVE